jgi:hypothetical protein
MERLLPHAQISSWSRRRLARWLVGTPIRVVERDLILETLAHTHGNRTLSARLLGVSVPKLRNKITQYSAEGLHIPRRGSRNNISRAETIVPRNARRETTTNQPVAARPSTGGRVHQAGMGAETHTSAIPCSGHACCARQHAPGRDVRLRFLGTGRPAMKVAKIILAGTSALTIISSEAFCCPGSAYEKLPKLTGSTASSQFSGRKAAPSERTRLPPAAAAPPKSSKHKRACGWLLARFGLRSHITINDREEPSTVLFKVVTPERDR